MADIVADMEVDKMADMVADMMVDMEDDNVDDMVLNMEVDKVANMMVISVGHTGLSKGRERRSQAGTKGPKPACRATI